MIRSFQMTTVNIFSFLTPEKINGEKINGFKRVYYLNAFIRV
jgi:hypothetical protein